MDVVYLIFIKEMLEKALEVDEERRKNIIRNIITDIENELEEIDKYEIDKGGRSDE
ncbi:MAG TPA: hypothetical protein PLL17_07230 [Defluviitaleaceae bacterium]|nr:hypothetical protein [Defluviitaleaceae bacterium]